jgi:hypothetical protein
MTIEVGETMLDLMLPPRFGGLRRRSGVGSYHWPFSTTVLPVVGLTRCADPHARQPAPTKTSSLAPWDSSCSGAKPCTRKPVFGQRKMNQGQDAHRSRQGE